MVASLDDLVEMKRAAGRPKDVAQVEMLRVAIDELRGPEMRRRTEPRVLGTLRGRISAAAARDSPEVNAEIAGDFEP
jgi:hypothetical protein